MISSGVRMSGAHMTRRKVMKKGSAKRRTIKSRE